MAEPTGRMHTATIKFGKGYEAPSYTPGASTVEELREQVIEFAGLESVSVAELSLLELIANVSTSAQAIYNTTSGLGGAVIKPAGKSGSGTSNAGAAFAAARGGSSAPAAPAAPAEPEKDELVDQFEKAADLDAFRALVTANQDALKRPEIQDAAKAAKARLTA